MFIRISMVAESEYKSNPTSEFVGNIMKISGALNLYNSLFTNRDRDIDIYREKDRDRQRKRIIKSSPRKQKPNKV